MELTAPRLHQPDSITGRLPESVWLVGLITVVFSLVSRYPRNSHSSSTPDPNFLKGFRPCCSSTCKIGAGSGARTHDLVLGKDAHYHCAIPACCIHFNTTFPVCQIWGDRRGSNPRLRLHRAECYHYTTVTMRAHIGSPVRAFTILVPGNTAMDPLSPPWK